MVPRKKIAITVGVFDCLHEGHINLLKKMRDEAEAVVVFLHSDFSTYQNKGRFTVQTLQHRSDNLQKTGLVDRIEHVFSADPSSPLRFHITDSDKKSAVYIRGDDWQDFPGRKVIEEMGIEIKFVPYTKGVSTSQIRKDLRV